MKWLLPLLLLLGACVITPSDLEGLTPTEKVYVLKQDFSNKLDVVLRYANQPPCSEVRIVACSDAEVIGFLNTLAVQVDIALDLAALNLEEGQIRTAHTLYGNLVNELARRKLLEVSQ